MLLEVSGRDATPEFEEAAHSDEARTILARYLIGGLKGYRAPPSTHEKVESRDVKPQASLTQVSAKQEVPAVVFVSGISLIAAAMVLRKTEYPALVAATVSKPLADADALTGGLLYFFWKHLTSVGGLIILSLLAFTAAAAYWASTVIYIEFGYGKHPSTIPASGRSPASSRRSSKS